MSKEIMRQILDKIIAYDKIVLFRHQRPDGDCMGATKGLKRILQVTYPHKDVRILSEDDSEFLSFLGPDDAPVPDSFLSDALGIVLDTGNTRRISGEQWKHCRELIKIDHHIPVDDYAPLHWVEEERSSTCEMVACFYDTFRDELRLDREAATCIFTGMVTDSGRFRFRSVNGDTMRLAGMLLDAGVDTELLFARLYLKDFAYLKFKAHAYEKMAVTPNGVAYIYVDKEMKERFGLSNEAASGVVSFLESIKGCLCWIAFIETGDEENSIRVRLRSRFAHINHIAEHYRGGGHACASGATVYGMEEVEKLLAEADQWIGQYKRTHEDWL